MEKEGGRGKGSTGRVTYLMLWYSDTELAKIVTIKTAHPIGILLANASYYLPDGSIGC